MAFHVPFNRIRLTEEKSSLILQQNVLAMFAWRLALLTLGVFGTLVACYLFWVSGDFFVVSFIVIGGIFFCILVTFLTACSSKYKLVLRKRDSVLEVHCFGEDESDLVTLDIDALRICVGRSPIGDPAKIEILDFRNYDQIWFVLRDKEKVVQVGKTSMRDYGGYKNFLRTMNELGIYIGVRGLSNEFLMRVKDNNGREIVIDTYPAFDTNWRALSEPSDGLVFAPESSIEILLIAALFWVGNICIQLWYAVSYFDLPISLIFALFILCFLFPPVFDRVLFRVADETVFVKKMLSVQSFSFTDIHAMTVSEFQSNMETYFEIALYQGSPAERLIVTTTKSKQAMEEVVSSLRQYVNCPVIGGLRIVESI